MKYQKGNCTVNRQSKEDGQLMKNYKNIVTNIDKIVTLSLFLSIFVVINILFLMINSEIDVSGFLLVQVKRQYLIKFIIILKQNDQSSVVFLILHERDQAIEL